jgi:hypothetical protein
MNNGVLKVVPSSLSEEFKIVLANLKMEGF